MHREKPISESHEMYLKAVYEVRGKHDVARVRDLALNLGVSPATVSSVLKKLEKLQLIEHERYGGVTLTEAGARVAECVVERFQTLRDVLVEVFGVPPEMAGIDACMMGHAASPVTVSRMQDVLAAVRAGKIELPRRRKASSKDNPCSDCEELGVCQAAQVD